MPASSTQRVWMKSAVVERELGDVTEERRLLKAALERFPYFDKLWLMLGQLEQRGGAVAAARLAYQNGLKRCIASVPLWRVRRCFSAVPRLCLHCDVHSCHLIVLRGLHRHAVSSRAHCLRLLPRIPLMLLSRQRRGWRSRRATCPRRGRSWSRAATRTRATRSCGSSPCAPSCAPACPRPPTR